jgi:nucleobase:cation symporter-1, NCS1 family
MDAESNPVFGLERRGFDHIPEDERTMTLRDTAYFWVGMNANLFFVAVGVIALESGLRVWQALVAVVLGTLLFATVALASIGGVRAGLPTMTFTRAVFGPRGNLPHVVLAWAASVAFEAINCIFGVYALLALMPLLGWEDPGSAGKILATLVVLGASAVIAIYGHATMVYLQRVFAVALTLVLVLVLAYCVGGVDWSASGPGKLTTWETIAVILAAGAVIASGPISYLFNGPDWVRYLPSRTASGAVFWTVFLASGVIALFLSVMGVLLASRGDMSDPVGGVQPFVPQWLYILYILAAVGGSIANNVGAYYSSGLCLQSAGLPLRRYQATALDTVVSTAMVLYILLVEDFTTVLHHFVALLVVWLGPFAAVWMTDGLMRRWHYDPAEVHDVGPTGAYWGWHGINPRGWIALLAGVAVCLLSINAPILQGPVSDALAGADLTWTVGPLVSAAAYWALARGTVGGQSRRSSLARATATARVSASSLR